MDALLREHSVRNNSDTYRCTQTHGAAIAAGWVRAEILLQICVATLAFTSLRTQAAMDSALTGNQLQAPRPMTNSVARDLFRSKVRMISSIVGKDMTHAEDSKLNVDESDDAVRIGVQQPHGPGPPRQAAHVTSAAAVELYARFNTTGDGLDRGQVVAAVKSNGVEESDIFFDVAFDRCDTCAIGRLDEESFVRFCSIVYTRKKRKERQESTDRLAKEVEQRAAVQALPGLVATEAA